MSAKPTGAPEWTPEEIAQILKAAELLRAKRAGQRLNVVAFCRQIGLSRKNAYKHKRHYEKTVSSLRHELEHVRAQRDGDVEKIRLLERRLEQAEQEEKLRLVMRELIQDYQKKEPGWTRKRQRLLDEYNRVCQCLGLAPLSLWE